MRLAALALLVSSTAVAAPTVHTHLGEVRACRPLGDDFLVGTGGGLARVDARGNVRAVWTAVDGLPGTRIDSISEVGGELWVGTELGAARIRVDGAKLEVARRAGTKSVRAIVEHGGTRYVATWDGGVTTLGGAAIAIRGGGNAQARARVSSLAVAGGSLYAGTAGGLYRLANGRFELVPIESGANEVASLYGDGDTLWIATSAGLYSRTGTRVRSHGGGELRVVTKQGGAIVVGGLGAAPRKLDRGRLVSTDLPGTLTQAIGEGCIGGLDGLWLRGGDGWNPAMLDDATRRPPANDVSALAVDGAPQWVGTFDHGVAVLERGRWKRIASRAIDHRVNAILIDRSRRVWIATATGVSIVEGAPDAPAVTQLTKRDGLPARGVLSLAQLADGRILAGTMHGAVVLGDGRPVPLGVKQGLEASNVWAVAQDAAGNVWLGTTTGLYRGRLDDRAWTRFSVATGHLRDDWVMALAVRGGAVWAGTYKGGVTRFDRRCAPPDDAAARTSEAGPCDGDAATPLGDGWVNPGGLVWIGDTLHASTMEGVRIGDGQTATWSTVPGRIGKDTTATARVGDTLWISTRRGIVGSPVLASRVDGR